MKKQKLKIKDSINLFVTYLISSGKSDNTIIAYKTDVEILAKFLLQELNIKVTDAIEYKHLLTFREYLFTKYVKSTCARKFNCVRTYIKFLALNNYTQNKTFELLKLDEFGKKRRDKTNNVDSLKKKTLSIEEIKSLLNKVKNNFKNKDKHRDYALICLLTLGLRRGDVQNLKWSDINFFDKTIGIRRQKALNVDIVTMPEYLFEALLDYNKICYNKFSYVFFSEISDSGKISNTLYKNILERNCINNGGHIFRHSFITNMQNQNEKLSVIRKFTGLTLDTLQTYTHFSHQDTVETANKLNSMFA